MKLDRSRTFATLSLLALLTIGGVAWRLLRTEGSCTGAASSAAQRPTRGPVPRPAVRSTGLDFASDGIPIAPAHAADPIPSGRVHPHPITAEHERIFRENRLIGALNGAMDVGDVPGLRRLLAQYRREYPEDGQMLSDGYAVIADCLEFPSPESRAAAKRWEQDHTGSTLRRFVIRHCLSSRP